VIESRSPSPESALVSDEVVGQEFPHVVGAPNLDAALAHLNAALGAPRFMVLREIVVENGWFRGVIEPVWRKSTYSEFLDRVLAGGVHQLG
jgi:hypothetical protein